MHENGIQKKVRFIGYPVSITSGAHGSSETPENVKEFLHPYLSDPKGKGVETDIDYNVSKEFVMIKGCDEPSEKKNGISNYDSVVASVTELGNEAARAQWEGEKSLTVGGDHSQGFATVKATLLVEVLRAVKDGRINATRSDREGLLQFANEGKFDKAGELLDILVDAGKIKLSEIKNVTNKISTIWIDAHGDYNTPELSPSGNFHGMSAAASHGEKCGDIEKLFGDCIAADPKNLYVVCERDLDFDEEKLMKERGVNFGYKVKTLEDTKSPYLKQVLEKIIKEITDKGNKYILSVDVDHILGVEVPETGTPMGLDKEHPNYRKNREEKSPAGPVAGDTFNALDGKIHDHNCLAADVTEIATKFPGDKGQETEVRGTATSETGFKVITALTAGKKEINKVGRAMKKDNIRPSFVEKIKKQGATITSNVLGT